MKKARMGKLNLGELVKQRVVKELCSFCYSFFYFALLNLFSRKLIENTRIENVSVLFLHDKKIMSAYVFYFPFIYLFNRIPY